MMKEKFETNAKNYQLVIAFEPVREKTNNLSSNTSLYSPRSRLEA